MVERPTKVRAPFWSAWPNLIAVDRLWLCFKSHTSFLDTVSTGSDSDLVSDQHAIFPDDFDSSSLTRSLSLPVLTVSKNNLRLPLVDLSALGESVRDSTAEKLASAEHARLFDLDRGPLARVLLIRLSAREHMLVCTLHHIISDGWSK